LDRGSAQIFMEPRKLRLFLVRPFENLEEAKIHQCQRWHRGPAKGAQNAMCASFDHVSRKPQQTAMYRDELHPLDPAIGALDRPEGQTFWEAMRAILRRRNRHLLRRMVEIWVNPDFAEEDDEQVH
jgi:hypothetical protein